ncbi:MAG: DUF4184 family protein [Candidatus Odinarchaeota archaeon]
MPLTPLHYPIAFITYYISKRNLSLPVLIVSSMISDIEIPFIFFITNGLIDRLILHSLIGSIFLGVPLSILLFYPLYKIFFKKLLVDPSFPVKSYKILTISAVIGVLSHVFLDAMQHPYNPLFWPIYAGSFNSIIIFNNLVLASNFLYIVFTVMTVLVFAYCLLNRKGVINQLFIG